MATKWTAAGIVIFLITMADAIGSAVNGEKHYVVQGLSASSAFDASHPTSECLDSESTAPSRDTDKGWGLAVRCCSMDGSTGYSPDCQSHGASGATFDEAEQLCSSHGLRLCTLDEALSGVAGRTGCAYDHVYHWVSDECGMFEYTSTEILDGESMEIGWVKYSSCIEGDNPQSYNGDYSMDKLVELAQSAVTVKILPSTDIPGQSETADYALTANLCSNPIFALNHGFTMSYSVGTDLKVSGMADTDNWIGDNAHDLLWNNCGATGGDTPFALSDGNMYWACGNTAGLHITSGLCWFDFRTTTGHDITVWLGMDAEGDRVCVDHDDGSYVLSDAESATLRDTLYPGEYLYENQVLISSNGQYQLKPQSDGNLVLRDLNDGKADWSSGTRSDDASSKEVKLHYDLSNGKLVLTHDAEVVWTTGVCHFQPEMLVLQSDGNLVLRSQDSAAYWAWKHEALFTAECKGSPPEKSFSLSLADWNTMVEDATLCEAAYTRDFADPMTPDKCPDGFPDHDGGLLCYEACPNGWSSDGLTMCYEDCPSDWVEVAGVCWFDDLLVEPQASVGRGVGIIPNSCTGGRVMESGLCYEQCRSGYTGFACHCWRGLFDVYGRGCGTIPNGCPSSHPSYEGGLCYRECPADHPIKDGPWCAEDCEAKDAVDTGLFCQSGGIKSYLQERYFRPSRGLECRNGDNQGFCYEHCRDGFDGVLGVCWNKNLGTSIAAMVATAPQAPLMTTCYAFIASYIPFIIDYGVDNLPDGLDSLNFDPFIDCVSTLIDTFIAIDGTWSRDGVTVAATYDAERQPGADEGQQGYAGIAFEFVDGDNVNLWAFVGACKTYGSGVSVGINGGISLFRSVEDIDGVESFFAGEVDVIGALSVGIDYGFDEQCQISGMAVSSGISVGLPIPFDVQTGVCANAHREYIDSMSSPAARSSAKTVPSHPEPAVAQVLQHENSRIKQSVHLEDEPAVSQPMDGDEGGDYVFVLNFPSTPMLVVIALSILLCVMIVALCVRCRDGGRNTYKGVAMDTDSEMEMADLNEV